MMSNTLFRSLAGAAVCLLLALLSSGCASTAMSAAASATPLSLPYSIASGANTIYGVGADQRDMITMAQDKRISTEISAAVLNDGLSGSLDVSVYCFGGHVYLVGEFEQQSQVKRLHQLARRVAGVSSVTSYMFHKDARSQCNVAEDALITSKVRASLISDELMTSSNVEIKTIQCTVVLLGAVGSRQEVKRAVSLARQTGDVRKVKSYLQVWE